MKWPRIFKKGGGTAGTAEKTAGTAEKTASLAEKTTSRKGTLADKKGGTTSLADKGSATPADKTTKTTKALKDKAGGSTGSATPAEKASEKTTKSSGDKGTTTPAKKASASPAVKAPVSSTNKKTPQQKTRAKPRKILELTKELEYLKKRDQEEVLIKDAEGRRYCNNENCDQPAVTDIYCRYHYLSAWKYLQKRKQLRENQYLQNTIQEVVQSMGTEALDFMLKDFKTEKNFERACNERDLSTNKEEENTYSERDEF